MLAYVYTTSEWEYVSPSKLITLKNETNNFNQSEDSKNTKFIYLDLQVLV